MGVLNELRAQQSVNSDDDVRYTMVAQRELLQIDGLCRYILDSNNGWGMVCDLSCLSDDRTHALLYRDT